MEVYAWIDKKEIAVDRIFFLFLFMLVYEVSTFNVMLYLAQLSIECSNFYSVPCKAMSSLIAGYLLSKFLSLGSQCTYCQHL